MPERPGVEEELRRELAAARQQEAKYRSLFQSMDEGYLLAEVLFDAEDRPCDIRYLEANAAAIRMIGTDPTGRLLREIDPGYEPHWYEIWGTIARGGEARRMQRYAAPTGTWYDFYVFRPEGQDAESRRVAVIFQDATERRRAEDALRGSEARFRALATAGSAMIYRMSPDWRWMLSLDGRGVLADTQEPTEHWPERYLLPEDRPMVFAAIAAAIGGRSVFELEHRVRHADGSIGWVLSRAVPILGPEGELAEWVGAGHDVTARRLAEERQAFLLRLADALRPLTDPVEVQRAAMRLLAGHLGVARAAYFELDEDGDGITQAAGYEEDAVPLPARMRVSDYGAELADASRAGRIVAVADTEADPRLEAQRPAYRAIGVRAWVSVPLLKGGRLRAVLGVHSPVPRDWTQDALRLLAEVAERSWAAVERARAEAALRESEERFRSFAENSTDVLWILDPTGQRLDYLSPAFERIFGEPRDRIMAELGRWRDLAHPDDLAAMREMPRARPGETVRRQFRVVRPDDGRILHLRVTGFPIRDAAGTVTRLAGIAQDVTDMVAARAALEAEKERFRALAEGIPQLVWSAGNGGCWSWASPQWTRFTGLSEPASRGRGWLAALHPEDRPAALAAWERAAAAGAFEVECRLLRAADGAWRWFLLRGSLAGTGDAAEWLGACTDIDDQMRAREVLARSRDELEALVAERTAELMAAEETLRQSQKMEAVGQLTGGIAHDFNNMLQGIAGGLDLARLRLAKARPEEAARALDSAGRTVDRAAALTRRLLAFARRHPLALKPVEAGALIAGLAELIGRTVGPAIAVELRPDGQAATVLCDPNELENALVNLCINARDAMPEGGRLVIGTGTADLSAADIRGEEVAPGRFVTISVADAGTGMPPEVLERAFEPFFTTKPQGTGTGLGLSQVYGFVRQSGGLLRIDSAPGQGTEVRLLLPLHRRAAAPAEADPPPAMPASGGLAGTVLLVDDEDAVREPAAEWLRELGLTVLQARTGPEALGLLSSARPDLLVTDVGLPDGMDGRALSEAARQRQPGLPVLFITGYARVALPGDARVIAKPFEMAALARAVAEALPRG